MTSYIHCNRNGQALSAYLPYFVKISFTTFNTFPTETSTNVLCINWWLSLCHSHS